MRASGGRSAPAGGPIAARRRAPRAARPSPPRRLLLLLIPYVTVGSGLHVFHSAWIAILSYHAALLLALLLIGRGPWRLARGWSARTGVPALIIAAANGPAFLLLWPIVAQGEGGMDRHLSSLGVGGTGFLLFAVWYATVHPLLEEAFWRGSLYVDRRRPALVDLAFSGYHLLVLPLFIRFEWAIAAGVVLAAAAFGFRRIAGAHQGLAVPAAAHAAAGASTMITAQVLRMGGL